jgi:hypothetical protein
MFYEWALSNGEMRMIEDIPFTELDELLARLYLGMFGQNFWCTLYMQSDKNINQEYSIETFHVIF